MKNPNFTKKMKYNLRRKYDKKLHILMILKNFYKIFKFRKILNK